MLRHYEKRESINMDLTQKNVEFTIDDFYGSPEGKRVEFIDGVGYNIYPPTRKHQKVVNYLNTEINFYIRNKDANFEVYSSPFSVYLNADRRTYVEPDISVICDRSKLTDLGCNGAPDWIIEVVSSHSREMDYAIKLFRYRTAGVHEYWIVDPEKLRILVYNFDEKDQDKMTEYSFSDKVRSAIYNDFQIDFSRLNME